MSETFSNQSLDVELPDALQESVDVVNTFVRGWTVRGSWNSKVDDEIYGRFELRQNAKDLNEFEIQLIYDKNSIYAPGDSRLWMLEGIIHNRDGIAARSKNFATGQSIMLELHRVDECVWVGNLTSIYPADLVGLTGIALKQ
jgi:hypothetical protein